MNQNKYGPIALASISLSFMLSSCAGPESYQQKMARYEPKSLSRNQVPDIKTTGFQFKSMEKSTQKGARSPASAPEAPGLASDGKEAGPTNKRLYFLTLLSEYESMKAYSMEFEGPSVSICPNFHTSLLRHKDQFGAPAKTFAIKKFSYDPKKMNDEIYISKRPELLLPLSRDAITPRVIDVIRSSSDGKGDIVANELVHKALDIHLAKTYSEIKELCEYGVSDNYYIYENLITHIKNNKFSADDKNMNTLLKTTIFSNMALMTSLEKNEGPKLGRSIASKSDEHLKTMYSSEVISRLNVPWVGQYFNYIKESR